MGTVFIFAIVVILKIDTAFSGYCTSLQTTYARTYTHCGLWGWSRCTTYRPYTVPTQVCCPGWRGTSCSIPICNNPCVNGGRCIGPNQCKCPASSLGQQCSTDVCSNNDPCYPGTCSFPHTCSCYNGFTDSTNGCLSFSRENNPPVISECEFTLAHIRRTDQKQQFYFSVPCSDGSNKSIIWCNQQLFNNAKFTMKSMYQKLPSLPPPPDYIQGLGFGIVYNGINVKHTKYPRTGDNTGRHVAFDRNYNCSGLSNTAPRDTLSSCEIQDNYRVYIEHNDFITVTYSTKSGGFRTLYNKDTNRNGSTQIYNGQMTTKEVEIRFDFIAPEHCSEIGAKNTCSYRERPIDVGNDITEKPIHISWDGWSDALSGIAYYYLEVFKLEPNTQNDLTEREPLKPIYQFKTNKTSSINFPTYHPPETGMYCILLQVSDKANNSKIARRLVLYDNDSSITLTKTAFNPHMPINVSDIKIGDGGMHVITAIPETGYMWQTSNEKNKTRIVLNWKNHFVNTIYDQGKLLNRVLKYPTQFADLQDDGVLRSKKYVTLTDNEGTRTHSAIQNIHGIVKFEVSMVYTDNRQEPTAGWIPNALSESFEINELLSDGSHVRVWVRATDIMNNTLADYTEVHIDNTPPRVSNDHLHVNIVNGTYEHTSRITFDTADDDSGVHMIKYKLIVGNSISVQRSGTIPANRNNATDACFKIPACRCVLYSCFLAPQKLDIDNCWFLVPKEDLNKSARIEVEVYNQALLYTKFTKQIKQLTDLKGLEYYSGPVNIRVQKNFTGGIRLMWDLAETSSCYGKANIDVTLYNSDGSSRVMHVHKERTSVDLVGLQPGQDYSVSFNLGYKETQLAVLPYTFKTALQENNVSGWMIAGIVVSSLIIVGFLIALFVILMRRGHMKPVERGVDRKSDAEIKSEVRDGME